MPGPGWLRRYSTQVMHRRHKLTQRRKPSTATVPGRDASQIVAQEVDDHHVLRLIFLRDCTSSCAPACIAVGVGAARSGA